MSSSGSAGPRKLRVAAVYGGAGFGVQLKALRRGVDIARRLPGPPHRPHRARRGRPRRGRDRRRRRSRPHGRHGLPARGAAPARRHAEDRQTLLFSATLDGAVDALVRRYQRDPVRHELPRTVDRRAACHPPLLERRPRRARASSAPMSSSSRARRSSSARRSAAPTASPSSLDQAGVRTEAIHGNRSQGQRERALAAFASGKVDALVATDVAARGIHVDDVACVVHFDPPNDAKDYMHRSGRTARAGEAGTVVSFVGSQQAREAAQLQQALGMPRGLERPDREALASLTPGRGEPPRPGEDRGQGCAARRFGQCRSVSPSVRPRRRVTRRREPRCDQVVRRQEGLRLHRAPRRQRPLRALQLDRGRSREPSHRGSTGRLRGRPRPQGPRGAERPHPRHRRFLTRLPDAPARLRREHEG